MPSSKPKPRRAKAKCRECEKLRETVVSLKGAVFCWKNQCLGETARLQDLSRDLARERSDIADLIRDLQLVTFTGTHMLCGSQWIRGEGVLEAIRRYTEKI